MLAFAGCSRDPIELELHDQNMSLTERISNASVIVVGRCKSVDAFNPQRNDPEIGLTKVTISVENVLKGNPPAGETVFYLYRVVGGFNGPKPNWVKVGDRGIFYLTEERGVLRSVHDIWESHTKVFGGQHDAISASGDIEAAIAEVVIVPGKDFDRDEYLHSLADSVEFLGVGPQRIVPLLETLVSDNDSEMRKYACVALSGFFPWNDDCLAMVVDEENDIDLGKKARDLIQQNAQIRANDETELRLAPAVFFSRISSAGSREARFILERLRIRPDLVIRQRASDLLQQMNAVGY